MLDRAEIKRRRLALNLTQAQAARDAVWVDPAGGPDRRRWQKLESGHPADPALSTVEAAARALRCQVADLLTP